MIRGSASAMFKAWCVSLIEKKPIRVSKAKSNFLFIALPSIMLYLTQLVLKTYVSSWSRNDSEEMGQLMLSYFFSASLEQMMLHFFVTFMVISRCMRTLKRVFEQMQKDKTPNRLRRVRSQSAQSLLNNEELVRDILDSSMERPLLRFQTPKSGPSHDETQFDSNLNQSSESTTADVRSPARGPREFIFESE